MAESSIDKRSSINASLRSLLAGDPSRIKDSLPLTGRYQASQPSFNNQSSRKKMRAQARQTPTSLSFRCASRQARPPKARNGFRKIRLALRYRWISGPILPPSRAGETRHKLLHYRSRHRADGSPTPFFMRWPVLPVALDGSAARSRHWQALDARRTLNRM